MCQNKSEAEMNRPILIGEYTFRSLLETTAEKYQSDLAYSLYGKDGSTITYSDLRARCNRVSSWLLKRGLNRGHRAAVYSTGSPEWMVSYLGIVNASVTAVPILPDFSSLESSNILSGSGADVVFVTRRLYPGIEEIVRERNITAVDIETMTVIGSGESILSTPIDIKLLEENAPREDDEASLIYTSGTTGRSKGVLLTHRNLLYSADEASVPYIKVKRGWNVLSILPMSHVYEFTLGNILPLMCGCHITVLGRTPSSSVLLPAFRKVRPQVIMTVPLIIEKIYSSSVKPVLETERVKKLCRIPLMKRVIYRLISSRILSALGGRMKFFGIGGAPLERETEEFLYEAGFPYALGYGLTETSPLISSCGPKRRQHRKGRTGKIVRGLEIKILSPDENGIGELAVKGPSVMKGYSDAALNTDAFTEDGFFRTGDLVSITDEGFLGIRGRSKTMILLSGGENIYPEDIESMINREKYVEESLVVNHSGVLTALVKLDLSSYAEALGRKVEEIGEEAKRYSELVIEHVNSKLSRFQRIGEVFLQENAFERTPTLKIKRYLY